MRVILLNTAHSSGHYTHDMCARDFVLAEIASLAVQACVRSYVRRPSSTSSLTNTNQANPGPDQSQAKPVKNLSYKKLGRTDS